MTHFGDKRVGFDVKGSPFGELRDDTSWYTIGYDTFTLGTFCDGYVFQKPFSEYEGCTVDPLFVTDENFEEALALASRVNPDLAKRIKEPKQFIDILRLEADIQGRFSELK